MKRKTTAAAVSIAFNLALLITKVVIAMLSGSVSVLSEALHSVGDSVASVIAYIGVRVADKPADDDHPFGHGKAESLAGLAEATLLLMAGLYIGIESFLRLEEPEPVKVDIALYVIAGTAVVNIFVGRYLSRVAKETDSRALEADAAHVIADFVTSLGVLFALALVRITGNPIYDPAIALVLSAWIIYTALRIAANTLKLLMDRQLPDEEIRAIEAILLAHPEVKDWHQLRTRKSGSTRHIDAHILLRDELSLIEAHEITEEVEDLIRAKLPGVSISLHTEPFGHEMAHRREAHSDQNRQTK
ncbi:MAG: cation diffusion facilitator family transporter [Fimbriimonadales bacterium]